ncbi:MAG: hypothetical protein QMC36_06340 [Patescibacteria group bacterium]
MEKLRFVGHVSDMDAPEARSAIDAAARKLSPENLEKILLEAYGGDVIPAESHLTQSPLGTEPFPMPDVPGDPVFDSPMLPPDADSVPENATHLGKWAALLAIPAGIAGYFGYRKAKKFRKEPVAQVSEVRLGAAYPALTFAASDVLV